MRYFVFHPMSTYDFSQVSLLEGYKTLFSLVDRLEKNSVFSGLVINEGHSPNQNFGCKDALLLSSVILGRSREILVGPCVIQLAVEDPKLIFERMQVATILSDRLILCFGNGYNPAEGAEFSLDKVSRRAAADFSRDVISNLVAGRNVHLVRNERERTIFPDPRFPSLKVASLRDSVASEIGVQSAVNRGWSYIFNPVESATASSVPEVRRILSSNRAAKRGLFIQFQEISESSEDYFLDHYNSYLKNICSVSAQTKEEVIRKAVSNPFQLFGRRGELIEKMRRVLREIEFEELYVQMNFAGMSFNHLSAQIDSFDSLRNEVFR